MPTATRSTSGSTSRREDEATYARVLDMCADALMTAYPSRFERFLRLRAARRVRQRAGATTAASRRRRTLRPTAIERRGRVVRVARLDPSRRACHGRLSSCARARRRSETLSSRYRAASPRRRCA